MNEAGLKSEKDMWRLIGYQDGLMAALKACNEYLDNECNDDERWYAVNGFRWVLRNMIAENNGNDLISNDFNLDDFKDQK
jgi:hypothetical protein